MKRVVDKHTVAHLWANKHQDDARTPTGNLYFNSNGIFSYGSHFLIAKHVENAAGERAILLTKRTYSNTTNSHINIVRSASRHIEQILVPDPDQSVDENFESWYTEIKNIASKLAKARKPEKYIMLIRRVMDEVMDYAKFFSLEVPVFLLASGAIQDSSQYAEILQKEAAYRTEQAKKQHIENEKRLKKQLKNWRAFKTNYLSNYSNYDFLRFNNETGRVETSQRIEIPEVVAQVFYGQVLQIIENGGCTNCDMMLMERYQVTDINSDFIKVGCHKIMLKEIKLLVKKLGW